MARILVVEDEPSMRKAVMVVLQGHGFEVFGASDAAEALSFLADNEVDLLITDVGLPDLDGVELVRRSRALRQEPLPVLFMSGFSPSLLSARGWLQEGMTLLEKPFTSAMLLAAINTVLAGHSGNT